MDGFDVAFLLTGLTSFIQLLLNFLTAAWPDRPAWIGYLAALGFGIGGALLFATANKIAWQTPDLTAQLVIVGVFAAAAAAGLSYQTQKAQDQRRAAQTPVYDGPERRQVVPPVEAPHDPT